MVSGNRGRDLSHSLVPELHVMTGAAPASPSVAVGVAKGPAFTLEELVPAASRRPEAPGILDAPRRGLGWAPRRPGRGDSAGFIEMRSGARSRARPSGVRWPCRAAGLAQHAPARVDSSPGNDEQMVFISPPRRTAPPAALHSKASPLRGRRLPGQIRLF